MQLHKIHDNFWKDKRVIITGIKGFVAPYLAEELLDLGTQVFGIDLPGQEKKHPLSKLLKEFKIFEGDLRDYEFVREVINEIRPDFVFHLAARSSVKKSFEEPFDFLEVNCRGTLNLLEAIKNSDFETTFIFAGSSDEYGIVISSEKQYKDLRSRYGEILPLPTKIPELPVDENNPLRPVSPYALTKVYGDFLTRQYSSFSKIKGIVSRAFNHEGPGRGERFVSTDIIKQVVEVKKGDRRIIKAGNIMAMRDWSHVRDIVKGYILLAEKGRRGEVYNLGSGRVNSVLTFILLALKYIGFNVLEIKSRKFPYKYVEAPLNEKEAKIGEIGLRVPIVDKLILEGEINLGMEDEEVIVRTNRKEIIIKFDSDKFRPTDIPILLCNPEKIKKIGFEINYSLFDMVKDMVDYFISLK